MRTKYTRIFGLRKSVQLIFIGKNYFIRFNISMKIGDILGSMSYHTEYFLNETTPIVYLRIKNAGSSTFNQLATEVLNKNALRLTLMI